VTRLTSSRLLSLVDSLRERDVAVITAVSRFRLMSGKQLERLLWNDSDDPASRARLARRALSRLAELGLLDRLERRVGGVRVGSAGSVYALGSGGQRLVRYWAGKGLVRGRPAHEPGSQYVRHTLAVAETYVRLVEAQRAGRIELLAFDPEPVCWRSYIGRGGVRLVLKPDVFVRVGVGAYEDRYFVEVDCGSEGRGTLLRKSRGHVDYWRSGREQAEHGVFPKVLWITTTAARARLLAEVCASLPAESWRLFGVTTPERALDLLAAGPGDAS
jgi:hypothetical protein